MKKFLLFALLAVISVFANAQETDVTTLDWTQKGQDCTKDFNNPNGGTVFGTDAGGTNLSYVDLSAYGQINLYGTPGQRARLFVNREEIGDKGIIFVDINDEGVGVYDFNNLLTLQPTIQYIHLNGVKASAWDTKLNLSKITVSGDPIEFPEDVWVCPEGETDVTKLAWVQKTQGCTNNLGAMTDAVVWGTDAGGTDISYVDISSYGTLKVYGPAGQTARFFINREEYSSGTFQFFADINEDGVGTLNLDDVLAAQEGAEYIHLNGIKGASYGAKLQIDGITVVEAPWTCPEGEIDYTTLPGYKDVNNVGKPLNGGEVVYGDQSNGDNYTDVTAYKTVKFYGTPGAMLRIFANRAGGEGVTVGKNEQRVSIGEDGVGTLNVKDVMAATEKEYCYLSGIKICATWQGASIDAGIVIKGITVDAPSSVTLTIDEALTYSSNKILDFTNVTGVEAYIATAVEGDKVTMKKVEGAVPANTGIVLVGNGDVEIPFAATATEDVTGNLLVATTEDTNVPSGAYVLAGEGDALGWYSIGSTPASLAAGKCYLAAPSSSASGAKSLKMTFGDATAIKNVEKVVNNNAIYSLQGIKVAAPVKGNMYIMNGKKVIY